MSDDTWNRGVQMEKILIVTEVQGYMTMSLKDKFIEEGYDTQIVRADTDAISAKIKDVTAIVIYADENILGQQQPLTYIKDCAAEENVLIFLVGTKEEIEGVERCIPKITISHTFLRPINVKDLIDAVRDDISKYGRQNKKKILVVDDSGAVLRNVKGWLEGKYNVILANSGATAIKYLALNKPDLVLLDYEMPVVDGKQVLEMIRSEGDFADVPVIFLTSKSDRESVMQVMALKPEGYLLKTMEPAKIVEEVDQFFIRQKMKRDF